MSAEVTVIKTEKQHAEDIRAALRPLLDQVGAIITQASRDGLRVSFSFAPDAFGRHVVNVIEIAKPL